MPGGPSSKSSSSWWSPMAPPPIAAASPSAVSAPAASFSTVSASGSTSGSPGAPEASSLNSSCAAPSSAGSKAPEDALGAPGVPRVPAAWRSSCVSRFESANVDRDRCESVTECVCDPFSAERSLPDDTRTIADSRASTFIAAVRAFFSATNDARGTSSGLPLSATGAVASGALPEKKPRIPVALATDFRIDRTPDDESDESVTTEGIDWLL
mmetsp:Transcript_15878/g.64018  ORF Transcript_15878/g.64018 Transcript_15878/m.64018 type:complete len:212 (+) Transcript_15878:695-1330(+)